MDILRCANLPLRAVLFLCAAALSPMVAGQNAPSLKWSVDTTKIRIGEQVQLKIEVRAPKDALVDFPDIRFQSDSMEVVSRSKIDTAYKKGNAVYKVTYRLTSFEKGRYLIPAIKVRAGEETLATDSFPIEVSTVPVDTLQQARYGIKDIRTDPYTPKEWVQKYYWIFIVLAILALLAWETYRLLKRRRQRKLSPEMLLSPYERAKYRLSRLDREKLVERGLIKDYYSSLTDVIRLYLEEEHRIPAPENTSQETLKLVRRLRLSKEEYRKLRELLQDADLVKFAKLYPSGDENMRYRVYTDEIIEALRPAPATEADPVKNRQTKKEDDGD